MPPYLKKPVSWRLCAKATSPRTPSASPSSRKNCASCSSEHAGSCGSAFLDRANSAICCALALALPMISVLPASVVAAPPFSSASFAATFSLNCAQWGRMYSGQFFLAPCTMESGWPIQWLCVYSSFTLKPCFFSSSAASSTPFSSALRSSLLPEPSMMISMESVVSLPPVAFRPSPACQPTSSSLRFCHALMSST